MNRLFLKQARDGVYKIINESLDTIIIQRQALIDDGFGGQVPDPFGETETHTLTVRLSHERKYPGTLGETSAGMSTNLQRFILAGWEDYIEEGDVFETDEGSWKIGPVDPLKKFGGIIGYQAPLSDAAAAVDDPGGYT